MLKQLSVLAMVGFLAACSTDTMTESQISGVRADCGNVNQKIAMLENEKEENNQRMRAGIGNVFPITAVSRFVTGTYKTNAQIASGEWGMLLDKKLAELRRLRQQCNAMH